MELVVERLDTLEALRKIEREWRCLATGDEKFFLSWEWVCTFIENPPEDGRFLVLLVREEGSIIGIAPFWISRRRVAKVLFLRALSIIGSREVGADHLDFLVRESRDAEVAGVIWNYLFRDIVKEWDVFEFRNANPTSETIKEFLKLSALDKRCTLAELRRMTFCPYVELPDGEDECLQLLSPGKRKELRRSYRRIADLGEVRFELCESVSEVDEFFDQYLELHQKSWNERGEEGAFNRSRFTRFHRELAKTLIPGGKLYLCNLFAGGKHIASLHGFVHDSTFYFYQSAADRASVHGINVGRVLLAETIKWCSRQGLREFDMLNGDEAYKYEWTNTERRELTFDFFNSNLRSLLAQFALSVRQNLRMLYRAAKSRRNVPPI